MDIRISPSNGKMLALADCLRRKGLDLTIHYYHYSCCQIHIIGGVVFDYFFCFCSPAMVCGFYYLFTGECRCSPNKSFITFGREVREHVLGTVGAKVIKYGIKWRLTGHQNT